MSEQELGVTEKRCKTCKFWGTGFSGPGVCERAGESNDRTPEEPDDKFWLHGWGDVELRTRPDFGCVMWEGKE